ncbi:manganese efflux pump MntP family protein [Clostridium homopropionicum]|uniref:manganese efflux pump MntP n=1 Tax=Clostridium homopropionicum TaxID=36844 RepID=UPI00068D612B|nr:manganese efflux pump [Clostridium homopropionicum]
MSIYSLFIIALALALDAFGVALSLGLNPALKGKNKIMLCASFGFFQFALSFLGAYLGYLFNTYILVIPKLIGGIVIIIVGIMMLKEGMEKSNNKVILDKKMYLILGISVSIDAAVVGFTALNNLKNIQILLLTTVFIGIVTTIICALAFIMSSYLRKINIFSKYADYVAGIILILFGLKMIFL